MTVVAALCPLLLAPPAEATGAALGDPPAATAAAVVAAFRAAGIPIGRSVVYTAATDPNRLLGKPGQYVEKASWVDKRIAHEGLDGGTVEIFASETALQARAAYLRRWNVGQVTLRQGLALVRVDDGLPHAAVDTYAAALKTLAASLAPPPPPPSPAAIERALLLTPFSEIPSDLAPARVRYANLSVQLGDLVGGVEVDVTGPDDQDGIVYLVAPSASAAAIDLADQVGQDELLGDGNDLGPVPGHPARAAGGRRSAIWEYLGAGGAGNIAAAVVAGPVIVEGLSQSANGLSGGSVQVAARLVRIGLEHLARVERTLAGRPTQHRGR